MSSPVVLVLAVLVAHYYTAPEIQALAEATGGCVSDSLEMARFGRDHPAETLIVAGVRFMGETAKILTPHKRVLMPTLEATCSLDEGCPIEEFSAFCDAHPDREVVVYANTSAAVKARADWVVTSSIALDVAEHLDERGLHGFLLDCIERGLILAPGSSCGGSYGTHVRVCFTSAPPDVVGRGIAVLADLLGR